MQKQQQEEQDQQPEIATVGSKGQIVIPNELRRQLKIVPKSKLAIYRRKDKLVITKLKFTSIQKELNSLLNKIDSESKGRGKKKPSEREILKEIEAYRHEKRP
jgi:AbrB family looped-hinge helix DNA binding protein